MCLDLPVQARCAILPVPERLHCAQCGCGPENRVSLSGAGVVRIIAVLLWQEMDQKIQSRRQLCHVTVLQDYQDTMSTNKEKVEAVLRDTLFETMSRSDLEKFAKTATAEVETLEAKVDELVSVHTADLSLIATMTEEIATLIA